MILLAVQTFGILVILPIYVVEMIVYKPVPLTWEAAATIAWIGVVVGVFAVSFMNSAVLSIGPNKASMSNYIRAIFTTILAIVILGENLQTFHIIAFILVITGIFLMGRGRRVKPPPPLPEKT